MKLTWQIYALSPSGLVDAHLRLTLEGTAASAPEGLFYQTRILSLEQIAKANLDVLAKNIDEMAAELLKARALCDQEPASPSTH